MERITIYPDKDLRNWLEETAKKEFRSLNHQILFILNKHKQLEGGINKHATREKPTKEGNKVLRKRT